MSAKRKKSEINESQKIRNRENILSEKSRFLKNIQRKIPEPNNTISIKILTNRAVNEVNLQSGSKYTSTKNGFMRNPRKMRNPAVARPRNLKIRAFSISEGKNTF